MEDLVKAARMGDKKAFKDLIEKLKPIRLSLIKAFPTLNSEDLDQDLVLVLKKCIESYQRDKASFPWYVSKQSKYYCLDKIKEKTFISLDEEVGDGMTIMDTLASESNVENEFLMSIKNQSLRLAMDSLEESERKIIFMYYFMNLSLSEIGGFLGYSVSHISRKKISAIKNLKSKIRKDDLYDY